MKDPHEKGTVMKLTREEFQKYIYAYNEDEIFYKTLYLQEKEHPGYQVEPGMPCPQGNFSQQSCHLRTCRLRKSGTFYVYF